MPTLLVPAAVPPWAVATLIALAAAAALIDLRWGRVPNWLTYPAVLMALAGHGIGLWQFGPAQGYGLVGSSVGLAFGAGLLLLPWLAGGIGGGDLKLLGAVGALGGWRFAVAVLLYGCIVALLMSAVVMVRRRIVRRTLGRVWTTLKLLVTPGAKPADPTGADSPRIPFAVALCVGCLAALLESALGFGLWRM